MLIKYDRLMATGNNGIATWANIKNITDGYPSILLEPNKCPTYSSITSGTENSFIMISGGTYNTNQLVKLTHIKPYKITYNIVVNSSKKTGLIVKIGSYPGGTTIFYNLFSHSGPIVGQIYTISLYRWEFENTTGRVGYFAYDGASNPLVISPTYTQFTPVQNEYVVNLSVA